MDSSSELSQANDYAIANAMNEEIYSALVSVYLGDTAGVSEFHDYKDTP